ncbi:tripartite tricarboxylate transporter permease [Aeromicrobium sp.]|uniref:tripartite tricarboxylate transporter permease n=1 Tax=Aeromicrobium sp. TaxID=1871063 RepID=UPI0028B25FC4|nr:tripartite tricarboxylate transporter permease [Aeromicrobium sp.]
MFSDLMSGFGALMAPEYLALAVLGVVIGSLVGVLPGIGPIGAMSILLGLTTQIGATGSLILFAGIYYGSAYGGSTTSILLNLPGESSSVVTAIDGHAMTRKGRAGAALTIAAVGSFIAGTISIIGLTVFAPLLGDVAVQLGPPEYLALTIVGLGLLVLMAPGRVGMSMLTIGLGLAIALIGIDPLSATSRFTFGVNELNGGLSFIALAMGLFGVAEVLDEMTGRQRRDQPKAPSLRELVPTREEMRRALPASLRGSVIGFFLGLVPGPAAVTSTFASYVAERKISKHPEKFGHGAVEGVAGPESANNAAAGAAFIPLLVLGIPFAPTMALVLAALLLNNVVPGPTFIQDQPELFWTVIAAMYLANLMLLVLNLPLVGLFTRLLSVPAGILSPLVLGLCFVGVYAESNSMFDVATMVFAGFAGLALKRRGISPAPLILAFVLAPTLESSSRQTLSLMGGDPGYLLGRPVVVTLVAVLILVVVVRTLLAWRARGALAEILIDSVEPADGLTSNRDPHPTISSLASTNRANDTNPRRSS